MQVYLHQLDTSIDLCIKFGTNMFVNNENNTHLVSKFAQSMNEITITVRYTFLVDTCTYFANPFFFFFFLIFLYRGSPKKKDYNKMSNFQ